MGISSLTSMLYVSSSHLVLSQFYRIYNINSSSKNNPQSNGALFFFYFYLFLPNGFVQKRAAFFTAVFTTLITIIVTMHKGCVSRKIRSLNSLTLSLIEQFLLLFLLSPLNQHLFLIMLKIIDRKCLTSTFMHHYCYLLVTLLLFQLLLQQQEEGGLFSSALVIILVRPTNYWPLPFP